MLAVSVIALVVSVIAAFISMLSVFYARRATRASEESAAVASREDHRARTPRLDIRIERRAPHNGDIAIYAVRNDGPVNLESVVVERPQVSTNIRHPVAKTGETDWLDEIDLGPLRLATSVSFTLSLGSTPSLPEFRVIVRSRVGAEEWTTSHLLDYPREPPPPRAVRARFG